MLLRYKVLEKTLELLNSWKSQKVSFGSTWEVIHEWHSDKLDESLNEQAKLAYSKAINSAAFKNMCLENLSNLIREEMSAIKEEARILSEQ